MRRPVAPTLREGAPTGEEVTLSDDLVTDSYASLTDRLVALHERLRDLAPAVSRLAVALYDPDDDTLGTFLNSTRDGTVLRGYQYKLSDSESLSYLARTKELRLLTDVQHQLEPTSEHSRYVLGEGYQSSFTVPMHHRDAFLGFMFFDSRDPDAFTVEVRRELELYASFTALAIATEQLTVRTMVGTIQVARDFTAMRDVETGAHLERMSRYARVVARGVAEHFGLTDEEVESIFLFAPLHDVGKIAIPDSVLLKPGPLTTDEWELMKTHTTRGLHVVDVVLRDLRIERLPHDDVMRQVVELHHEALDGSGYPHGLRGDDVPVAARVVAVADVFDALTSRRPYKEPWDMGTAFHELVSQAERGRLDRACVDALRHGHAEAVDIAFAHPDPAPV